MSQHDHARTEMFEHGIQHRPLIHFAVARQSAIPQGAMTCGAQRLAVHRLAAQLRPDLFVNVCDRQW